jgi:type IV secretory pathway VirB2 component (pilin)
MGPKEWARKNGRWKNEPMNNTKVDELLSHPSRHLSMLDALRVYVTGPGSTLWTIVAIIMAFAWLAGGTNAVADYFRFPFEATTFTKARVIDADDTNAEINERSVSWVSYSYIANDEQMEGISFGTEYYPKSGVTVKLEYLNSAPWFSRIPGRTRVAMAGPVAMVLALISLCFVPFALWRTMKARNWVALMRSGQQGLAVLKSKEPTQTTVNERRVYKLEFEYAGDGGKKRTFITKRHNFDEITDDAEELVLFDEKGNVLFFDELPVPYAPGKSGAWRYVGSRSLGASLAFKAFVPALILGLNAAFG